jgi:5-methylcytosine-specific restriction endonuclease McrA
MDSTTRQECNKKDSDSKGEEEVEPKKQRRLSSEEERSLNDYITTCERFNISETAAATLHNLKNRNNYVGHRIT